MNLISNEQQKDLLLLSASRWKQLRADMKTHYRLGTDVPDEYKYLLALSNEQWQTLDIKLDSLRHAHKEKLQALRKQARAAVSRQNKREYMRNYMQRYRAKQEPTDGQGSREGGG